MRKVLYITGIAIMASINIAQAQIEIGAKTGIYFSNASIDGLTSSLTPDTKVLIGSTTGITADIPLGSGFSFAPELLYTQKGFVLSEGIDINILGLPVNVGATVTNRINYIESPLLMKYTIDLGKVAIYGQAGPSIAFATSAHTRATANVIFDIDIASTDLNLESNNYNRWDLAANVGAGLAIKTTTGKIFSDIRYQHGFNDIIEDTIIDIKVKNRGIGVTAGYAMTF